MDAGGPRLKGQRARGATHGPGLQRGPQFTRNAGERRPVPVDAPDASGHMPPHDNATEMTIRDIVVLHHSVRHQMSEPEGGQVFSVLVSVARTCQKQGVFPRAVAEYVIRDPGWRMFKSSDGPKRYTWTVGRLRGRWGRRLEMAETGYRWAVAAHETEKIGATMTGPGKGGRRAAGDRPVEPSSTLSRGSHSSCTTREASQTCPSRRLSARGFTA